MHCYNEVLQKDTVTPNTQLGGVKSTIWSKIYYFLNRYTSVYD